MSHLQQLDDFLASLVMWLQLVAQLRLSGLQAVQGTAQVCLPEGAV